MRTLCLTLTLTLSLLSLKTVTADLESSMNLYIIPNLNDQFGWRTPLESQYSGIDSLAEEKKCTKCTLDAMLNLLEGDKETVFQAIEIVHFEKWFTSQSDEVKLKVKKFVEEGRLAFPNGGWVNNDEATSYYEDIIDQMILGHDFLKTQFNYTPAVAWRTDKFGHSTTQASLLSQMGYKILFIQAINAEELTIRDGNKNHDFLWRSWGTLPENYLLTQMISFKSGEKLKDLRLLLSNWDSLQKSYSTSNIIYPLENGIEFAENGKNISQTTNHFIGVWNSNIQEKTRLELATLDEYVDEWYRSYITALNTKLQIVTGDFFSYTALPSSLPVKQFWTGYFGSKPHIKQLVKDTSRFLDASRKIYAKHIVQSNDKAAAWTLVKEHLNVMEKALAIAQSTNAVGGVASIRVTQDYIESLSKANADNFKFLSGLRSEYFAKKYGQNLNFGYCQTNKTSSDCSDYFGSNVILSIFNPGHAGKYIIKVKVPSANVEIRDEISNKPILESDVVCHADEHYNTGKDDCNLYFKDHFDALESKNYIVVSSESAKKVTETSYDTSVFNQQAYDIEIDSETKFTVIPAFKKFHIYHCDSSKTNCISEDFYLNYYYYQKPKTPDDLPKNSEVYAYNGYSLEELSSPNKIEVTQGHLITEITIHRSSKASKQVITKLRLFKDAFNKGIEIESHVFPIEFQGISGKEVILRIKNPNLRNKNIFYTDSNGLEMVDRFYSYKPEYDMSYLGNPITDNYYPINSAIYIEDPSTKVRFTLMTERSQAGSCQGRGEIEVLLHSRNIDPFSDDIDDSEPDGTANKPIAARTTNYLLFSNDLIKSKQRENQVDLDNKHLVLYAASSENFFKSETSPKQPQDYRLPEYVKISLKSLNENDVLIRFTNLHDTDVAEFEFYSGTPKTTNHVLSQLLDKNIITSSLQEVSLTGNQLRSEVLKNKLVFRELYDVRLGDTLPKKNEKLVLRPLEIRTFIARNVSIDSRRVLTETTEIAESSLISSGYITLALTVLACVIALGVSVIISRKIKTSSILNPATNLPVSTN